MSQQYTYSTIINDPKGDIYLKSSDDVLLLLRKIQLQAASSVFEDMLGSSSLTEAHGGNPIVSLAETRKDLESFLVYLVPDAPRPFELDLDECEM